MWAFHAKSRNYTSMVSYFLYCYNIIIFINDIINKSIICIPLKLFPDWHNVLQHNQRMIQRLCASTDTRKSNICPPSPHVHMVNITNRLTWNITWRFSMSATYLLHSLNGFSCVSYTCVCLCISLPLCCVTDSLGPYLVTADHSQTTDKKEKVREREESEGKWVSEMRWDCIFCQ